MAINDFEKVRLYDVQTGKERVRSPDHHRSITELIFSSDGRNLFSGDEAVVCNWTRNATDHFGFCPSPQIQKRMEAFNRIAESELPQGEIFSVDLTLGLNRNHKLLTLSQAHPVKNNCLELEKDGGYTNDYISPDNQRVLLRRHKPKCEPPMACEVFDTTSGKRIGVWPLEGMLSSTFGPDSRFFAWQDAKQGQIILGNLRSGKIVKTFSTDLSRKPERPANHFNFGGIPSKESRWSFDYLALSPDNQRITAVWNSTLARLAPNYSIGDQNKEPTTLYVWDVASGKETTRVGFQAVNKKMPQLTCLAFLRDGRTLAAGYLDNADVHLIESASGRERAVLHGHQGTVRSLVLSPDGHTLLSGSDDTTILVWDLDHLPSPDARKDKAMLSAKELKQLWEDLAHMDAGVAFQAIETLRRCPEQAVTLLQERLQPITAVKPERIEQWIRDLDNNEFPVRERASTALECLAEIAEPALKRALEKPPSLEVRLRLQRLMETTNRPSLPPDRLRQVRGVELLERIATPTAREHLRKLANGAVEARLTHEAKEGLRRTSSGDKAK